MIIFFTTIVAVPLMLIFAGLAIDIAALGVLKDRVQVAADASATATAAAIHFVKDDPECVKDCAGHWAWSPAVATAYAQLNGFPVQDAQFDPATPRVSVVIGAAMPTSFLRLVGVNVLATAARADAVRTNVTQEVKDAEPPVPGRSALVR